MKNIRGMAINWHWLSVSMAFYRRHIICSSNSSSLWPSSKDSINSKPILVFYIEWNNLGLLFSSYMTSFSTQWFSRFACWGDLILIWFQNKRCNFSVQTEQKCESWLLLNTKMPEDLWLRDCVIVETIKINYMLILLIKSML